MARNLHSKGGEEAWTVELKQLLAAAEKAFAGRTQSLADTRTVFHFIPENRRGENHLRAFFNTLPVASRSEFTQKCKAPTAHMRKLLQEAYSSGQLSLQQDS